jgi:hypothetical protein
MVARASENICTARYKNFRLFQALRSFEFVISLNEVAFECKEDPC